MNDMFDSLPDEANEDKPQTDAPESEKKQGEVKNLSTGREVSLLSIESNILDVTIDEMIITTAEERAEANEIMGRFKKCEKQIKTFEATHIAPKKAEIAEIVAEVKPFKNKIASLVKTVQTATKAWDLEIAQAARVEQEKERQRIEKEKAAALEKMIENKRKGEKTADETLEKVMQKPPAVGSVKVETDRGTSSGKLGKVWFIMKTDGTEYNKKERLPYSEIEGFDLPSRDISFAFGCVDTVQTNEEFKRTEGANFPTWIQIREEIINSRFTE